MYVFFKTVIPLYFSTKTILYLIDNFSLMMSKCANMSVLTDRVIYYHVNTFTPFLKIFTIWNCYINNRKKTLMQQNKSRNFSIDKKILWVTNSINWSCGNVHQHNSVPKVCVRYRKWDTNPFFEKPYFWDKHTHIYERVCCITDIICKASVDALVQIDNNAKGVTLTLLK